MTVCPFVDTNVFLRYLLGDYAPHSQVAAELILQAANGSRCLSTSATVVFETMFTLTKTYKVNRDDAAQGLREILELDSILIADKSTLIHAFDLFAAIKQLSFADCYHAALSLEHCNGEIYTFDKEFRRVPGITRLEPGE
jgi:predicted nucleic acid-binding protein